MQKIVIDSDIIIDHFRIGSLIFDKLVEESVQNKTKVYLPGIVYTEINSGQDSKDNFKLKKIEELLSIFEFIPANQTVSQIAGFLIRDYPNVGVSDAIVAATSLGLGAKLVTRNIKHFQDIKALRLYKIK